VPDPLRLLYLIGQHPAINHGYLLAEIRYLRRLGFEVPVVSVREPDRPVEELTEQEREEAVKTYYLKSVPVNRVIWAHMQEALQHPWNYSRGLIFSLQLTGGRPSRIAHHLAYFAEAVLVGRKMRQLGVSHLHASFSATVALLTTRVFPVTMSFGVYGFGELHDPVATNLPARIAGSLFVRSISRHGRGQLMLSCSRTEWSKLHYVPLGIDPVEYSPRPRHSNSSPIRLLCVGRLAPEKGQILLLQAIAELRNTGIPLSLHLVGDGPDRAWLERQASVLGVADKIIFEGRVDQGRLMALYAETDIFALPSLAEGIPMVLMEAMAMEMPCVAPHISGIPELIENGVDGMLFPVADVEHLARVIRCLLESPDLRVKIGQRARARIERDYNMARNTERFAALLQQQLRGAARG
jgi:glycosyltransferase involved in cell wall biosynthesis